MKILFLTNDMRVKHFHMASAIKAKMNVEVHLMHIRSITGDRKALRVYFPYPNRMWYYFNAGKARFIGDAKESGVFNTVQKYDAKAFEKLQPNVVYVNDLDGVRRCYPPYVEHQRRKVVCDIEDLALLDVDIHKDMIPLHREHEIVSSPEVDMFLFGSQKEYVEAKRVYPNLSALSSRGTPLYESRMQYPFVAESTLIKPESRVEKTKDFSVVYAGSIWSGGGYKDTYSLFAKFGKLGINLDVYMLNDWNTHNWKLMNDVVSKYDSVKVFPRLKMFEVKQKIQQYHAGLYITGDFTKVKATFGMKPLEYAYAGVVPVGLAKAKSVRNLSDGKPFGYVTPLNQIAERYWDYDYLKNFDLEHHLMDNHIFEFSELIP